MNTHTRRRSSLGRWAAAATCVAAIAIAGCGDSSGDAPMRADAEALGPQIDRMGRAGVNTALIATFDPDDASADARKNAYNRAARPSEWAGRFAPEIGGNLAVYDSLDTVCGNQLLAADAPAAPGRYDALAGALADDRLYVNTASGSCDVYLAVEANATGVIPNDDCGGRTPVVDTIDVTYSALAIGAVSGVGDGVPADDDGSHSTIAFPFLDAPL